MIPKSSIRLLATVVLLTSLCHWANAEVFTAIVAVAPLLDSHKRIIDDLDYYIVKEETRLKSLKTQLNRYKKEHEKAMENIPDYLGNPINAFTLIKRLTTDLNLIENTIKQGTEYTKNITMNHPDMKYPTLEDLAGAAQALTRLQDTYRLDVHELSEGMLNGPKNNLTHTPMTADDCYELGKSLYNDKKFESALLWMTEALRKYKEADEKIYSFTDIDILEYIAYLHYLLGDVITALEWTQKVLALDPNHVHALDNLPKFTKTIEEEKLTEKKRVNVDLDLELLAQIENQDYEDGKWKWCYEKDRRIYEALCRGDLDISNDISKRLKCWYSSENHPFLKYAPIKTEQMYIKPDIFVFHEVLSDSEIEMIKSMALPKLQRSSVHDPDSGISTTADHRISKVAWIFDEESPEIARISQRVSDMTGLNMISAEALQVVNYGIGGHYEPHFDYARPFNDELKTDSAFTDRLKQWGGNRIATILFYMSDVAQGGATVFTELGLSLFPVKGAAAFWLNLHPSGEGNMATRHGACPVLRGSKWASNKWIHLLGQEFRKPCSLEYQNEGLYPIPPRAHLKTLVPPHAR